MDFKTKHSKSMTITIYWWVIIFAHCAGDYTQPAISLTSPDSRLVIHFQQNSTMTYSLEYQSKMILDTATLSLAFINDLDPGWTMGQPTYSSGVARYTLLTGKASRVDERYNELDLPLLSRNKNIPLVTLKVRIFDDGVAFRYEFMPNAGADSLYLVAEESYFNPRGVKQIHALLLPHFQTSHEGLYTSATLADLPADTLMDIPVLFELEDSIYLALTEAALRGYGGMYLVKNPDQQFVSTLSPRLDHSGLVVKAALPHQSPWRVIMVADHPGSLMTSNILTNLNEPLDSTMDWSWLKPGKSTWSWWNGDIIKGQKFPVGLNMATQKYYIDFCVQNHIEYHAVIEHNNRAWYYGEGEGFDPPPPAADVTRPVEGLNLPELCSYAKAGNVGIRLWVHWKPLSEKLEEAFTLYEQWGISGLMVDFMDRDDQDMVQWVDTLLHSAARHKLHIQFHGAYKPTGLHRTFPNELTKEGVLNLEANKWDTVCDPKHNLMIPYTRLLAGPVDYHAGGFRAAEKSKFKTQFHEPLVMGTRAHYLGMYVVFESYLQLVSDFPQAYHDEPGFDFVQSVPTIWDESKFLDGAIGHYVVMARRKSINWYLGAMNDWTPRESEVNLGFLENQDYQLILYEDSFEDPNTVKIITRMVTNRDSLKIKMSAGGGYAAILTPLE